MPNQIHGYHTNSSSSSKIIIFSSDYIAEFHSFSKNRKFEYPVFRFDSINLKFPKFNDVFGWKGLLYTMVSIAINQCKLKEIQQTNHTLIPQIIDYISCHLHEKITLEEMADTLGYTYHYISARIKTSFGMNFASLVNNHRVDKAATLLHTTDISITQAAVQSGFSNIRSFNRAFKKNYGITPSEFVKNKQN